MREWKPIVLRMTFWWFAFMAAIVCFALLIHTLGVWGAVLPSLGVLVIFFLIAQLLPVVGD